MTNSIDSYVESKMGENDRSDMAVPEDMGEKCSVDEIKVMLEMVGDEAKHDHSCNLNGYDPSHDIPIALRKGTRYCTKHPICTL